MDIKIKLFDKTLPLPEYKTSGAAGFDLYARLTTEIKPKSIGYVPLNVALELPDKYWVLLAARSSTHKLGLLPAHGIGVGDSDFKGDDDEYVFPAYNFTDKPVTVKKGHRIAQMVIMPYEQVTLNIVEKLGDISRGKFGTTGTR